MLEVKRSRDILNQFNDNSSSLIVLRDAASFTTKRTSCTTERRFSLSRVFDFDVEVQASRVYQGHFRSLLKRIINPKTAYHISQSLPAPDSPILPSAKDSIGSVGIGKIGATSNSEATPTGLLSLPARARTGPAPQYTNSQRLTRRSLLSIAASKVPGTHEEPLRIERLCYPSTSIEATDQLISANTDGYLDQQIGPDVAELILLGIMEKLDDPKDLIAFSRVNRGFYRTFKRNELLLLKGMLRSTSPAAFGAGRLGEVRNRISELEGDSQARNRILKLEEINHLAVMIVYPNPTGLARKV